MSLRVKRQLMGMAYYGIVIFACLFGVVLGGAWQVPTLSLLSLVILVCHGLTFRFNPLPRMLQERFIQQTECPACGEVVDLVNTWNCSCGYVTWQPRHAFSPCPNCKKVFRWLTCPQCQASILT